jgi:hypothetical protein
MLPPRSSARSRSTATAVGIAGTAVFVGSVIAAFTRPFTWPADVVTALGLLAVLAVVIVQLIGHPPALLARRSVPDSGPVASRPGVARWTAWAVAIVLVAGWEVYSYLSAPRAQHPTFSSLLDTATGSHAGRGVVFAVWLVLGAYLVTR